MMNNINTLTCVAIMVLFIDGVACSQMANFKKRVGLIERRLREDIDLLREEFGIELDEMKKLYKSVDLTSIGQPNNGEGKSETSYQSVTLGMLENIEKDLHTKFAQLQKGFQSEKIWRRDVQHQLGNNQQNSLKSIESKIGEMINSQFDLKEVINETTCSQYKQSTQMQLNKMMDILISIEQQKTESKLNEMIGIIKEIKEQILGNKLNEKSHMIVKNTAEPTTEAPKPGTDCADLYRRGHVTSGVYSILPNGIERPIQVYCDMETDGGGWTVMQRRCDGSENFTRSWEDYRFGFGNLSAEFWLGNEYVSRMTSQGQHEMRIELEDFENDRRFAKYSSFKVASPDDLYRLTVDGFSGDVMDSLIRSHDNVQFSTVDNGPKSNCASKYKAGFWYPKTCYNFQVMNINGLYFLNGETEMSYFGIIWYYWKGYGYSLKFTEMKFRPK